MDLQCLPRELRHGADLKTVRDVLKGKNRQPEQRTERGIENGRGGHHPAGVPVGQRGPDSDFALVGPVRGQAFRQRQAEPAQAGTGTEAGVDSNPAENRQPATGGITKHPRRSRGIPQTWCIDTPGRVEAETSEWAGVHSSAPDVRQTRPGGSKESPGRRENLCPTCLIQTPGRAQAGTEERAGTCSPTTATRQAEPGGFKTRHRRRRGVASA